MLSLIKHFYGFLYTNLKSWAVRNSKNVPLVTASLVIVNSLLFTAGFHVTCAFGEMAKTPWNSLGYMFTHGSCLHLAGNMVFLSLFGPLVERSFGHIRFLIFYLASGAAAVTAAGVFAPDAGFYGASAAVAACMAIVPFLPKVRLMTRVLLGVIPFLWIWDQFASHYLIHVAGILMGWFVLGVVRFYKEQNLRDRPKPDCMV